MLPPQCAVHLLVPNDSNERILHGGRVALSSADEIIVEFDRAISPPVGTDVNIFFEINGKFMQQGASIVAVREPEASVEEESQPVSDDEEITNEESADDEFEPVQVVAIHPIGQPVSAETRGSFRVSVLGIGLYARLENDRRCQLVDVSPEGFAAICSQNHRLGSLLKMVCDNGVEQLEGRVRVQTVRELGKGKFRCGFLVPSVEKRMRASLQKMTSWAQRLQLQRIRKSA